MVLRSLRKQTFSVLTFYVKFADYISLTIVMFPILFRLRRGVKRCVEEDLAEWTPGVLLSQPEKNEFILKQPEAYFNIIRTLEN